MQQLVYLLPDVPQPLVELYMHHNSGSLRPSTKELTACFISIIGKLTHQVLLLGDAFDECRQWNRLYHFVTAVTRSNCGSLRFLFTSRPEQYIADSVGSLHIPSVDLVKCEGIRGDIESFVRESVWNSHQFSKISEEGKSKIEDDLTERANGMLVGPSFIHN
jgi:hypothetical protein